MLDLFGFFTRVPVKGELSRATGQLYFISFLAFLISLVPITVYILSEHFLPHFFTVLFSLISLYLMTGILHLDGLSDFADGVMKKGSIESKIKALKDVNTGTAGVVMIIFVLLTEFIAIDILSYSIFNVIVFFLVSELSAKFSMLGGLLSKKAPESGLAKQFMEHFNINIFIIAILLSFLFVPILKIYYLFIFTGFIVSYIILRISTKNFGFLNGDGLGAMNELARAVTMVILCLAL
ncbi:MAG: adenosylcobinamide-GDP ribazoletransferase [Thermoplasmata archaeon]